VVGGGNLQHVLSSLLGGVGDLAVVDDDGVAVSAALGVGPADALGELGLGVGEEQLEKEGMLVNVMWDRESLNWRKGRNIQCHHR
jgi:hypothetical protein